jgi:protein MpaA
MEKFELSQSPEGRSISALRYKFGEKPVLLMGGVHGDEPEGYFLVETFVARVMPQTKFQGLDLWIIPRLNVDGCANKQRTNSRGVDLNRNMPTKDWTIEARAPRYYPGSSAASEMETRLLIDFIETRKISAIISAHSWEPMINYNGPAKEWAEHMAKYNGYRISDDIGYPTPGSLGTWAGWERNIPTLTLEIQRDSSEEQIIQTHLLALEKAIQFLTVEAQ